MKRDIIEIRWHGRGGQGAITAAKIVAKSAFESGYRGVVMVPTFGTERRGAPVFTSLKISKEKIYDLSPSQSPNMVVVLDHLLLEEADVTSGLQPGGWLVLNTPKTPEAYRYEGIRIAVADVTSIAGEAGLSKGIVNSGIIGTFAKASQLMDIHVLMRNIEDEFSQSKPHENSRAAFMAYQKTVIGGK
ncbi:MAG: 2-oxoacid:acceptor oxidoreductase family protein [Desulfobacterales bacterium]|nr:2-oxoacid:acceptor oxidoreductase family protein [Desulfobacterales bacterium]